MNNEYVGENLRNIRIALKLSQKEMAKKLGYSVGGYIKIENGTRGISISRIRKVADILGCTPNDIFLPPNLPDRVCNECEKL